MRSMDLEGRNMNDTLKPTGILLVGTIFICLSLTLSAAGSISDLPDLQKEMKRSLSGNLDQSQGSAMGKLRVHGDTITFPWSERHKPRSAPRPPVPMTAPSRERIALNESNPHRALSDLTAINSCREREVIWEGGQEGDRESGGLSNSLAISVTGQEMNDKSIFRNKGDVAMNIERVVDGALNEGLRYNPQGHNGTKGGLTAPLGNNMIIDVSGISVSAINTVKGGSATATSNIIIRPVQIILCPSEVEEKLK